MRPLLILALLSACSGDDGSPGLPDAASGQKDAAVPDARSSPDAAPVEDQSLGSACTCDGNGCNQIGVPKPAGGTIIGCDLVPTTWPGAARVCLRTYAGALANATYFANGYCSMMATSCSGASLICDSAVFGDYDTMVACPAGLVLIQDTQAVNVVGQMATVRNKLCAKPCTGAPDCRTGETDPELSAPTQYQCLDKSGVKFCYDPRNLTAGYTATQF